MEMKFDWVADAFESAHAQASERKLDYSLHVE